MYSPFNGLLRCAVRPSRSDTRFLQQSAASAHSCIEARCIGHGLSHLTAHSNYTLWHWLRHSTFHCTDKLQLCFLLEIQNQTRTTSPPLSFVPPIPSMSQVPFMSSSLAISHVPSIPPPLCLSSSAFRALLKLLLLSQPLRLLVLL
jgi:hypothetical protein